jgi:nucleoside-diphosphate-sugar epimerase
MKILVTGATGFIGGAVARKLSQQGHEVLALSRSDAAAAKLRVAGLTPVAGDFAVPASLAAPAAQVDAIVSTASIGQVEGTPDSFAKDRDAVAVMTKALGESGKPLIFTSGSAIFGVFTKGEASPTIFDEDYPVPLPASVFAPPEAELPRSSTPSAARWRRAPKRRRPCSRRPAFGES